MNELSIKVNDEQLKAALSAHPKILKKKMSVAIGQIIAKISRTAKEKAPKAFTLLTHSIQFKKNSAYEGQVTAGADYAAYVEEGRKPGGKMPPLSAIHSWINVRHIEPNSPDINKEDLVFLIRRAIAKKGTKPQPFMQPALEQNRTWAINHINQAIQQSIEAI